LRVVVCTKEVPDTAAKVEVTASGEVTWGDAPLVINPWDEYAVEEAILLMERGATGTTVVAVGGESSQEALKHALAMGMDDAVQVSDDGLATDSLALSKALAGAIGKLDDVGLVIMGKETSEGNTGETATMVGRRLGWSTLTYVFKIAEIDFGAGTIKVERLIEDGKQIVESKLPVVISVVKDINDPRYPSFMGIRKASRAEIPVWSAAEVGAGDTSAKIAWEEIYALPPREGACEIIEADSADAAAAMLADKLIEEKVI
jgi:electron transfer flavoprotein beta subunit